jgi:hypothetical protein
MLRGGVIGLKGLSSDKMHAKRASKCELIAGAHVI